MGVCKHCLLSSMRGEPYKTVCPFKGSIQFVWPCKVQQNAHTGSSNYQDRFLSYVQFASGTSAYRSVHCEHFGPDQWYVLVGGTLVMFFMLKKGHRREDAPWSTPSCLEQSQGPDGKLQIWIVTSNAREGCLCQKQCQNKCRTRQVR